MKAFRRFLPIVLLLGFGVLGAAAEPTLPIHFTASANPSPARPGEVVTVTVNATLDPDWHVYSVVPVAGNGPAATEITAANAWKPVGPTMEDTPTQVHDPNFDLNVTYHEKTARFTRPFRLPAVITATNLPINVTLHYQTCNHSVCLPPRDAVIAATLQIGMGTARPEYAQSSQTGIVKTDSSLGLYLLAALGAGLLALITPCVFPLIPITLTSFVKQADGDKGKLVRLAGGYALGIVALYVAVGAVVAATLGATGANKLAANPWVNLIEFFIFFVFALSFFETITLQLPANLGALQTKARQHSGLVSLLLLGITFVLASFTCTAPFIGTLLVAAAGGEKFRPLLGTLVFALAFVSPFLLFAAFPQWIVKIPKSGIWLARTKATLGFLELAAALKFLSNADQVWQWKLLTQPVLLAAWAIIFLCAALYLLGTLRFGLVAETETDLQRKQISPSRLTFAGIFLFLTLYCFWGLAGRPLSPYLGAFLPPPGYGGTGSAGQDGLPWLTDYQAALAQAKVTHKPLLIDFTGYTCTNCRFNEKNVFPRSQIQAALADYVRVQLYTDGGKDGPQNQKFQETKFGDVTLPLYGILDPQTEQVVGKVGGLQSVAAFTQFLTHSHSVTSAPAALWAAYTPEAFTQATATGKPVILDFTAAWCTNCKQIEREVFADPSVLPILGRDFVTLRADLTQWTAPTSTALQKQYGFDSLPTIVLLDKSGQEIKPLRITGRLSVADFLKRLHAATSTSIAAR